MIQKSSPEGLLFVFDKSDFTNEQFTIYNVQ